MMLFLNNNQIANTVYLQYLKGIQGLEESARRVATGLRISSAADAPGEVGVADLFRQKVSINDGLLGGLTTADGYLATQGTALDDASDILDDMSDLASDALDTTLTTTDRIALDSEFQALQQEFSALFKKKFNNISLFGASLTVRVGLESTDTATLPALTLNAITFNSMTLSQLASASAALISLTSRIASLNKFIGISGAKASMIDRATAYTQSVSTNLQNSEDAIRNIDIAIEAGIFTQQQVILASAQSVLTQSSNLIQSLLTFLS